MKKKLRKKSRWMKMILACLSFQVCCPALATQELTLNWQPSPSPYVTGYFVYYGSASGIYTTRLDVGLNTQKTITNLQEGQIYYFVATAYDAYGDESLPSNETQYITPGEIQLTMMNSQSMTLQFPVAPGHWYEIQASTDLKQWTTLGQTSIAVINMWMQFTDLQRGQFASRFYRLIMH